MKKETSKMAKQASGAADTTISSVRQMYDNYDKTGHFAAVDLRRVLGDPCQGVEILPSCEMLMASKTIQK
jgi:hypothetical protein